MARDDLYYEDNRPRKGYARQQPVDENCPEDNMCPECDPGTEPSNNCFECCAVVTDPDRCDKFGYQEDEITCECHDICVQDVRDICCKRIERFFQLPGQDAAFGCRGIRIPGDFPGVIEECRVICADETLVQSGPNACIAVNNEVGIQVIIRVPQPLPPDLILVFQFKVNFTCLWSDFHRFPSGAAFSSPDEFREEIKLIDGSCKTIIIEECEIVQPVNAAVPCIRVVLKIVDKLWKHENLLVSALKPYPDNITINREFAPPHRIEPCADGFQCPGANT